MFGGQDDNAVPQNGGGASQQEEPLNGVSDLADPAGNAAPTGGFMAAPSEPAQSSVPAPTEEAEDVAAAPSSRQAAGDDSDLMELKQQALQQLTPLVGHLQQSPEDRFRTTMMLIQASDNQSLLKDAYEAAQAISDEKVRAQALLDVVNEINYFTQNKQG